MNPIKIETIDAVLVALLFGLIVFGAMSQPPVQTRTVIQYSGRRSTW